MKQPSPETYVYKCLPFNSNTLSEDELNHLGAQGWLLVSTLPCLVFVKRLSGPTAATNFNAPLLLSIKQVSEYLAMSRSKVYELIRSGKIASIQIGRMTRVPRQELEIFIRAHLQL